MKNDNSSNIIKKYRNEIAILKLLSGTLLICFPDIAPASFLLYQGIRAVGWDQIKSHSLELIETYQQAKRVFTTNLPGIKSNIYKLHTLEGKLDKLNEDFTNGRLNETEYQKQLDTISKEMEGLKRLISDLSITFNQISQSTESDKFKDLTIKIYSTLYMCIATASSSTAATFTIGMNIGKVLSNRINIYLNAHKVDVKRFANDYITMIHANVSSPLLLEVSKEIESEKIISSVVELSSSIFGLLSTYFLRKLARTISSCMTGAELVVSGIEDLFDPMLKYSNVNTIIQASIMCIGITRFAAGQSSPKGAIKVLLAPLNFLELAVQAIFVKEVKL